MAASFSFTGFIIGRRNTRESDVLLNILTKKRGRVLVKAKGLKKILSKRLGVLQTGNLIKGKIFTKGDFHVLGEVELIFQPKETREDLVGCGMLLSMCELIGKLMPENDPDRPVYSLFWETLLHLSKELKVETMIGFEVKLLHLLGYGIPSGAVKPLRDKNWKVVQTEIWRYLGTISGKRLMGLKALLV